MRIALLLCVTVVLYADSPWIQNVQVSQDPGTGNQNETTMGILNDSLICAGYNDNRMGLYHVGFAASYDGGVTWQETLMFEPNYPSDADPCIVVNDSGHICYVWLSYNAVAYYGDIFITKSRDWGQTWGPSINVTYPSAPSLDDKPWAAVDRNNVFVTWREFNLSDALKFKRSSDWGETWGPGVIIGENGNGSMPFRGTDSIVYVGWGMQQVRLNKSYDMGTTWEGDTIILPVTWSPPSTSFRLNNIPSFATSNDRTVLYVVFADSRLHPSQLDVFFSRSINEGETWSEPVKINDTPSGDVSLQFYPWLTVDSRDRLHVVWHDTRDGHNEIVGQYYAYSTDSGSTWSANERISDTSTYADVFIGDYTTCASDSHYIHAVWCDCRNGPYNPDIFYSKRINDVAVWEHVVRRREATDLVLFFPTPFTDNARITYRPADAELTIYQTDGRRVNEPAAQGVYFVVLRKDNKSISKKLVKIE